MTKFDQYYGPSALFVLFAVCIPGLSRTADESSFDVAIQKSKSLARVGDFQAAEAVLRSAISQAQDPNGLDAIQLWNEFGHIHESLSQLSAAEQDYTRALRLNERLAAPNLIELATSLNNLGTLAERLRHFSAAEAYFRRSLTVLDQGGLQSSEVAGSVLTNLAMSVQKQGRLGEPLLLYESGLKLLEKAYGENSPEYAKALCNFGLFEFESGNYAKALALQKKGHAIEFSLPFIESRDKAFAMNNLGLTLLETGNIVEAEPLLRSAVTLQKASGRADLDVALTLNNLALLEQRTGMLEEARRDQTEGLRIAQQTLSPTDPTIAMFSSNLGKIAASQGRMSEAKDLYKRALLIWLNTEGKNTNYAATLSNVAEIKANKHHRRQARALFSEVLEIDEKALGSSHPRVAHDLSNIAVQLYYERKFNQAIPLFQRAKQIEEKALGPNNLEVAGMLRNLGAAYGGSKDYEQAEQAYRKAIEISRTAAKDTAKLMTWLSEYAAILRLEQKFGEAEQAYVQANGIRVHNAITATKEQRGRGI